MLSFGSDAYTMCKRGEDKSRAAEIKFMRMTAGGTGSDWKRNLVIVKELNTEPVVCKYKIRDDWL